MTAHPTPEELGAPDLKVAGFQLWVHGRQFPDSPDYYDGNWLRVTAHAGAAGASVWAAGAFLMVTDLIQWAHECDALVKGEVPAAELDPMEPELKVRIWKVDRLGHFTMRVQLTPDHLTQAHSFEFEIDQTYLPGIAAQCRTIADAYPVRGQATKDGV
ncbi:MAG TPA: hypothetical protein VNO75_06975 [Gemmatimonadaceae bacterium]|nr:hypothetical protein [Gemmatimonadaceae bacterium]